MSVTLLLGVTFVCGVICGEIDNWRVWLPVAMASGLVSGLLAKSMGLS